MEPSLAVEIADRMSRKRAVLAAVAAAAFLAVQVIARPFFVAGLDAARHTRIDFWALNALALLLVLATGGGLLNRRQLRALVNDEISRAHRHTAIVMGYWVAMAAAMTLFMFQSHFPFTGGEVVYIIVSSSLVVALLAFSYLEYRAHRDA
jgi:membrane protease YdiL (CAAX protease family)